MALTVLQGCSGDSPPSPPPPPPAVRDAVTDLRPPPPLPLSHFSLPVRYDFTPIVKIVERVVPTTFGSMDSVHMVGTDDHKHYAYEATRGPFTAFAEGSLMHLRATVSYSARGFYKPRIGPTLSAGCGGGNDKPRVTLELVTPLTLSPTWHLVSHASVARFEPASADERDRCVVSILQHDVTDRVIEAARGALTSHLGDIDGKIAEVDLTGKFTEWWGVLSTPIHLADGVWLVLGPERLRVGSTTGSGRELTIRAELDAHPRIVAGAEPALDVPCLPPLARATGGKEFQVTIEGAIDYATASHALADALRGKTVTESGRSVIVQSANVAPLPGGRLQLSVTFEGDASGVLAFQGSPHYDARTRELTVPDLDYDLATDNALINTYAWLKSDALRKTFRERARISVSPLLDRGRALLLSGLNRKIGSAVTLSATLDSVAAGGLYVTRSGVVVRATATGKAAMAIQTRASKDDGARAKHGEAEAPPAPKARACPT